MKRLLILACCLLPLLAQAQFSTSGIRSVTLNEETGKLEVFSVFHSSAIYAVACGEDNPGCATPPSTRIKEIYGVKGGRIVLEQTLRERRVVKHEETVTWEPSEPLPTPPRFSSVPLATGSTGRITAAPDKP
jgi:hypothetical protein